MACVSWRFTQDNPDTCNHSRRIFFLPDCLTKLIVGWRRVVKCCVWVHGSSALPPPLVSMLKDHTTLFAFNNWRRMGSNSTVTLLIKACLPLVIRLGALNLRVKLLIHSAIPERHDRARGQIQSSLPLSCPHSSHCSHQYTYVEVALVLVLPSLFEYFRAAHRVSKSWRVL